MYSAEQSGWGHSLTHGPGAASQWVKARNWCGPQRAFARGHGLQTLTTRPRGACPLTGRDRDVGRTSQIERSLKEVSGLKASRSSAQSVSHSGPCAAARATIPHLIPQGLRPATSGGAQVLKAQHQTSSCHPGPTTNGPRHNLGKYRCNCLSR